MDKSDPVRIEPDIEHLLAELLLIGDPRIEQLVRTRQEAETDFILQHMPSDEDIREAGSRAISEYIDLHSCGDLFEILKKNLEIKPHLKDYLGQIVLLGTTNPKVNSAAAYIYKADDRLVTLSPFQTYDSRAKDSLIHAINSVGRECQAKRGNNLSPMDIVMNQAVYCNGRSQVSEIELDTSSVLWVVQFDVNEVLNRHYSQIRAKRKADKIAARKSVNRK